LRPWHEQQTEPETDRTRHCLTQHVSRTIRLTDTVHCLIWRRQWRWHTRACQDKCRNTSALAV